MARAVEERSRLFSGAKLKHQWKAYLERFDQMATDDNELHAAVFGDEFARALMSLPKLKRSSLIRTPRSK